MNWLRYAYPKYCRVTTAIPNGGKRPTKTVVTRYAIKTYSPEGYKLKKEGVKALFLKCYNGYRLKEEPIKELMGRKVKILQIFSTRRPKIL